MKESVYADMVGKRFGRLTVLELGGKGANSHQFCVCRCDCGVVKVMYAHAVKFGGTVSCGCHKIESIRNVGQRFREEERIDGTLRYLLTTRAYKSNTSGRRGVSFSKKRKKWEAYIRVNGKTKHLGLYDTFDKAVQAREEAEVKFWNPVLEKENGGK